MRILLIEDSERLRRGIEAFLRQSGYVVDCAEDGEQGLWLGVANDYDLAILDIMLPKLDGLAVLRQLRAQGRQLPIMMLTAKDPVADRVAGLRAGADDYLTKPFEIDELMARVEVLCRRPYRDKQATITVEDLKIDTVRKKATRAGRDIDLVPLEYAILEYLARRRGEVVSRTEIEAHSYGEESQLMSNVINSTICTIRKKLSYADAPQLIHTRRGFGYVLGADLPE